MASSCAGTEAYYVLLMNTKDSTHRIISTVLSTGLFGTLSAIPPSECLTSAVTRQVLPPV